MLVGALTLVVMVSGVSDGAGVSLGAEALTTQQRAD
jgi:hypothetical protein